MSLFLIFNIDDKRDDVLEAANIDDGDDAKKKSINNRDATFEAVEDDRAIPTPMKLHLLMDLFFFEILSLTYHSVCP
jgi:hypothetical protein